MTDEQATQYFNDQRPSLEELQAEEIDLAMTLADDPDYAAEIRGWE